MTIRSWGSSPSRSMNARARRARRGLPPAPAPRILDLVQIVAGDLDDDLAVDLRNALQNIVADGCEKLASMPGIASTGSRAARATRRLIMLLRHCDSGSDHQQLRHLISFGSVPSSGRPSSEMTVLTRGRYATAHAP